MAKSHETQKASQTMHIDFMHRKERCHVKKPCVVGTRKQSIYR